MPTKYRHELINELVGKGAGFNVLYDVLRNTKVENAKASIDEDRIKIMEMIKNGVGYYGTNLAVNEHIRSWINDTIYDFVWVVAGHYKDNKKSGKIPNELHFAKLCNKVGELYYQNGIHDRALVMFHKYISILEEQCVPLTAGCKRNIVLALGNMGEIFVGGHNYIRATAVYNKVERIATTLSTTDGCHNDRRKNIHFHNTCGRMWHAKEEYEQALTHYYHALSICDEDSDAKLPETAATYNNIGLALSSKRLEYRYDEATDIFQKALATSKSANGRSHPFTATVHSNLADLFRIRGLWSEALAEEHEAKAIREVALGRNHPLTLTSEKNIGVAIRKISNSTEGLDSEKETTYGLQNNINIKEVLDDDDFDDETRNLTTSIWGDSGDSMEIEASALCEVNDWLNHNQNSCLDKRRAFIQEMLNKMVASVRYGLIRPEHASRSIHECAGLMGLHLAEDIPADTLIVTGMRKTVKKSDVPAAFRQFGEIHEAAVSLHSRGFGIVRFRCPSSVSRAMAKACHEEIIVQDVAVTIVLLQAEPKTAEATGTTKVTEADREYDEEPVSLQQESEPEKRALEKSEPEEISWPGDDSDSSASPLYYLEDEFDQYKDQNLEKMRLEVEGSLPNADGMMSRALTKSLMNDTPKKTRLLWGGSRDSVEIEASALCEVNDWLKRNQNSSLDDREDILQETLNKMVASVRHCVIRPEHAARSILECAYMIGLHLAKKIPATLVVTGMRKTVENSDVIAAFQKFGKVYEAAVSPNSRGFGIVRFKSPRSVSRAIKRFRNEEIVVQDVAVIIALLGSEEFCPIGEPDEEFDSTQNLADEFDEYMDENLEQMRAAVEDNLSNIDSEMSNALTKALMESTDGEKPGHSFV